MSQTYFVILTVIVLLPAVCDADLQCDDGTVEASNATSILGVINAARKKLADGEQANGKNGELLPMAAVMKDLEWNCSLELTLKDAVNQFNCGEDPNDFKATVADHFYEPEASYHDIDGKGVPPPTLEEAVLGTHMNEIDEDQKLSIGDVDVTYEAKYTTLKVYANLMRSSATKFACAIKTCNDDGSHAYVCATDQKPLADGEKVYDILQSTTSTTTITTTATTTTTVTPTTIAPTTIAPTSTAPAAATTTKLATTAAKESTGTPCPTYSTTPCPTYSTTPCPTYPTTPCPTYPPARAKREAKTANENVFKKKAKFPKATPGENTICSSNKGMTDSLRTLFLNMHNYRRAKLALGEVNGYDRKRMPPARNMLKLSYACELEASALRYAAHCPSMRSKASARPNQGENFLRLAKVGFPDFADAVNMTVYNWWDVVRDTPGIDKNAKLQTRRLRSPIVTFTQMAWATTRYLGCAIADCNSYYVSICRYSPKGNAIGEMVYKPGHTCTECKRGTTCEEELGLCV